MAVSEEEAKAIGEFYAAVDRLKSLQIVRSDKYLGDIAEFLARSELGMTMAESQRQVGYDGHIGEKKLQVKYSGGTSTTVDAGDPSAYDDLVIILGPHSVLRPEKISEPYIYYRIPSEVVGLKAAHSDGKIRFSVRQIPQSYRVVICKN